MIRCRQRTFRVRATIGIALVAIAAVLFGPFDSEPATAADSVGISGAVTAPGGEPLPGIGVFLRGADDEPYTFREHVFSDEGGRYSFTDLATGSYQVLFQPQREEPTYNYVAEWWENKPGRGSATIITLSAGMTKSDVNAELTPGASVSGIVTDGMGNPIMDAVIWARRDGGPEYGVESDRNGMYRVAGLPSGTYALKFESPWNGPQAVYVDEWWDNTPDHASAARFAVAAGEAKTGIDAQLSTGSTISGRVLDLDGQPISEVFVEASRVSGEEPYEHGDYSDGTGRYSIGGLSPGSYAVSFRVGMARTWAIEMWRDVPSFSGETLIVVGAQDTVELADTRVGADVERIAGSNRYITAVEVSKWTFPETAPVVYVASGQNFPDALAAAPIAGIEGGPVLLTPHDSLPDVVAEEITRLHPERIVVVGGEPSVSMKVAHQLDELIVGPVERVAGMDRYGTAVEISNSHFTSDATVVYLASGETFPDALAAAPLAALENGPVLLTQRDGLPQRVESELLRLRPARIVVLGGEPSVGRAVIERLTQLNLAPIERLAGPDRYSTAVEISKSRFSSGGPVLYLANGQTFPDALAAAPAALMEDAPVLLTPGGSLPQAVAEEITRLRPSLIIVLGGAPSISWEVEAHLARMAAQF